jgi:hypothetical protein
MRSLIEVLRKVYGAITVFMQSEPVGKYLKYSQIPSILTESLAIHLLRKGEILHKELDGFSFNFGGKISDITAIRGSSNLRIEVKATGPKAFQYFSDKDIHANYIIWIHFGSFFMGNKNTPIEVYIIRDPNRYFPERKKIVLSKLKKIVKDLSEVDIDLDKL